MGDFGSFLAFRFKKPALPLTIERDKVRCIEVQVHCGICVLDGETKRKWNLGKSLHVWSVIQKLCKFPFEIIIARHQVEYGLPPLPDWARPWERLATRKHSGRFE